MTRKIIDLLDLLWACPGHLDDFLRNYFDYSFPLLRCLAYACRYLVIPRKQLIAPEAGMARASIPHASNRVEKAIEILGAELQCGDVVLLKGASADKYRRILLGLQGRNIKCTVKRCV